MPLKPQSSEEIERERKEFQLDSAEREVDLESKRLRNEKLLSDLGLEGPIVGAAKKKAIAAAAKKSNDEMWLALGLAGAIVVVFIVLIAGHPVVI